jgi:uncharacterized membrane protein YadS
MSFPLSLYDLSLWLAAMAIILLITSELLIFSPEYSAKFFVDKKLLRLTAVGCGICFAVLVVLHVAQVF